MSMNKIYKGTPTKDGRCYYFRKSKHNKQYTSKKYKTREECEKALSIFVLKNDNPINIRFDLVAEEYFENLKKYSKPSTVYTYRQDYEKHILPHFEKKYINKINISNIREWAQNLESLNLTVDYMNKISNILKKIFDYSIKNYGLEINPISLFGRFKRKNNDIIDDDKRLRYITLIEFNQFISTIDDELWKAFFLTAYYTGCRKGELLALTWEDVDFNSNEIKINKTLCTKNKGKAIITSTKTNKNRKIKMSKTLKECLYSYKLNQIKYKDYSNNWFVFGGPVYLAPTTIDRHKETYFKLAGVNEITMHEFRHSHVSLLINEYIKSGQTDTAKFFLMLSDRMGHTIDVMQKTYMHLFPTVQNEIVNLLDNL